MHALHEIYKDFALIDNGDSLVFLRIILRLGLVRHKNDLCKML